MLIQKEEMFKDAQEEIKRLQPLRNELNRKITALKKLPEMFERMTDKQKEEISFYEYTDKIFKPRDLVKTNTGFKIIQGNETNDFPSNIYISLDGNFCSRCKKIINAGEVFGNTLLSNPEESWTECWNCMIKHKDNAVGGYFRKSLERILN